MKLNTENIIGHKRQKDILQNLLASSRIANTTLFIGPWGIGKKLLARKFLMSLFCQSNGPVPCMSCSSCIQIQKGTHPDFYEISPNEQGTIPIGHPEKKPRGTVRWLIDKISRKSITGKTGIIIDGIDQATEESQSALLKTIEEPAFSSYIILIAESRAKIPPTILSRSFEIKFYPLENHEIKAVLNSAGYEENDTIPVLPLAGGSPGMAELLLDKKIQDGVFDLLKMISDFINNEGALRLSLKTMNKLLPNNFLIDITLNYYRNNLITLINNDKTDGIPVRDAIIKDEQKIKRLIKILLALKKGQTHNLNLNLALKGSLYNLTSENFTIPF